MATIISSRIGDAGRLAPADSAVAPKSADIVPFKTLCSNCNLRDLCVPCCRLNRSEMELANRLVFNRSHVRRGETLYRTGDRFTCIYAVRNGFFKSTVVLEDGRRDQVTGFSMTGDVMGMDGIGTEWHSCNTVALEDSVVCAIPFAGLQELAHEIPSLQQQLRRTMSHAIVRKQGAMLLLGRMNAEERLTMFLLNLSKRFEARGYSPTEFHLRMSRDEIGSYLGMTLETVSRTFSRLQEEGLLDVQQKFIRIVDSAGLAGVMGRDLK